MTQTSPLPGGLSISSSIEGGIACLSLRGELDLAGAPVLERSLLELERRSPGMLVVDLGGLRFIDSTGLRLLLAANARARERGGELVLRPGDANVQRVFDVTGALEVLRFEDAVGG